MTAGNSCNFYAEWLNGDPEFEILETFPQLLVRLFVTELKHKSKLNY